MIIQPHDLLMIFFIAQREFHIRLSAGNVNLTDCYIFQSHCLYPITHLQHL